MKSKKALKTALDEMPTVRAALVARITRAAENSEVPVAVLLTLSNVLEEYKS